ncbi:oxidoreductase [Halostreptopolyspora alba]|uniref:SDR family oxidoreductase n=1 Tax=Halostreptopolyspora alba TaxID=2487137 RepID=A0A3N0E140_9ACTN|nr:SDR family oxidoreductase [Nocardiopsaceae bacterium YIM 96095]
MELNLKDKSAVVTGGSKGIGLATAAALAAEGARVVVGSRTVTDELADLRVRHDVTAVEADLTAPDGPRRLVDTAVDQNGGVDILVNNLGISEPAESSTDFSDEQWRRIFEATLFTTVRTVRAALPAMRGRAGASIVNLSSVNAKLPLGTIAPYSAAKAALTNFGKALAEELTPRGIRVNTVSPGPVRTPLWTAPGGFAEVMAERFGTTPRDLMERGLPEAMSITTGRVSEPEEIADLVIFLLSDRAGNITGSDHVIDGGTLKTVA